MRALRLSVLLSALAGCVAVPGRAPTAAPRDPTQPEFSAASLERSLHAETNRVQAGARVLRWNAWLAPTDATRRPAPPRPDSRAASRPGRIRIGVAENLARYGLYRSTRETTRGARVTRTTDWYRRDELAAAVVAGWLASPAHRHNLLDVRHASEALGVVVHGDDAYVTQSFF